MRLWEGEVCDAYKCEIIRSLMEGSWGCKSANNYYGIKGQRFKCRQPITQLWKLQMQTFQATKYQD